LGKLPETRRASTMFIDVVGVPVSPGSVAVLKNVESVEDRLDTLDKLAAGGYITKQEYNTRKQTILDSL
jgi:hypothetical protein